MRQYGMKSVMLLTVLVSTIGVSCGVKIAMVHMFGGSHYLTTGVVGEELARRGHQVKILSPENVKRKEPSCETVYFDSGFDGEELTNISRQLIDSYQTGFSQELKAIGNIIALILKICLALAENEQLGNILREADLLIIESPVVCGPAIARLYEKPWVAISPVSLSMFMSSAYRIPINPSYVPFFKSQKTDNMDFFERLGNFLAFKAMQVVFPLLANWQLKPFKDRLKIPSQTDILEMAGDAKMIIASCDFVLDYPFPLMPNTFCVGPFLVKPAKALPEHLSRYVNTSDGFILAAFGTVFNTFKREQVKRMAASFGSLKQQVIWQLQEPYDIKMPDNVIAMKWVPQNDLLGHPNIRLFISHMGSSSSQQAVYHGVPVLGTPRAGDQWSNGYRLRSRVGMAEIVNIETIEQDEFLETIKRILANDSYKQNAKKGSRRLKTKKHTSMQMAGDLIEYVIDNDYDVSHLRAHALELPFYIHDLWDIYLFFTIATSLSLIAIYYGCKSVYRVICLRKIKTD